MTNPAVYREPMSREDAFEELRRCSGTQFDPDLVEQFIDKTCSNVDESRAVIEKAVQGCDSVEKDDKPIQIFAQAFGASSIDFEVTWWTGSTPLDIRQSRDKVISAIKRALDDAGIEIPFPYRTLTFKEPLPINSGEKPAEEALQKTANK